MFRKLKQWWSKSHDVSLKDLVQKAESVTEIKGHKTKTNPSANMMDSDNCETRTRLRASGWKQRKRLVMTLNQKRHYQDRQFVIRRNSWI